MIEGMQLIVYYHLLRVDAPANIGLLQAVMRTMATFEVVNGDWLQEHLWKYDEKEKVSYYLQAAGISSNLV